MNNNLDKTKIIEGEKLDSEFYFQSLLEQAYTKGMLSDSDIERLQYECLNLLAYKTETFNGGDSSSIRVEKAQSIMRSNLFTISLHLKTFKNPDDAVAELKNKPITEIYQKGRMRINSLLSSAKIIHSKLLRQLVDTPNVFYSSTIDGGIKGFFKLYYPDYSAHEIHITADYPVSGPMPKLAGIEFIQSYINSLYYENQFCSYFKAEDTYHLLCGYVVDYQEHLINIYEPILLTALGCVIAGIYPYSLDISKDGIAYLCHLFSTISSDELFSILQNLAKKLIDLLNCEHGLVVYIQKSLSLIADKIRLAIQENTLNQLFFLPDYPENRPKILFSFDA